MNKKLIIPLVVIGFFLAGVILVSCLNSGKDSEQASQNATNSSEKSSSQPLNLTVFVDLSDRIEKEKDNLKQFDKDQTILNALIESFIDKQQKEGFQKSQDSFQLIFYPAPAGAQKYADKLCLDLSEIKGPKKKELLNFKSSHEQNIKELYENALKTKEYFGSDIWGFFFKDKVRDYYKDGYRNVIVFLSDGYIFDANNKIKQNGNEYSYLLPQTLAVKDSNLIPCKISNSNFELLFIECNPNPQTDFIKMKSVLETWFQEMGIPSIDIQDTDLPANTIKHLNNSIFK
ncbi:MAG: hypothetical protein HDS25_02270 [Bacteroides sp.]|nr:hypothetical protein [Bacteroidales bacterium]MBD5295128.1 hypothetical protein [Bacteroides sp.]